MPADAVRPVSLISRSAPQLFRGLRGQITELTTNNRLAQARQPVHNPLEPAVPIHARRGP